MQMDELHYDEAMQYTYRTKQHGEITVSAYFISSGEKRWLHGKCKIQDTDHIRFQWDEENYIPLVICTSSNE